MPSSTASKSRRLAVPRYKSFKLSKRIKSPKTNLPSGFRLFRLSFANLWRQKKLFGGIFLVYLILSLIFVKDSGAETTSSELEVMRTYQMILFVTTSLAIIWALRQATSKTPKSSLSDSFYKSMHPLVPFQLVAIVIALQLIPIAIASYLYQQIFASSLPATALEQVLWAIFIGFLCLLSLYMLASSIFALYIVTLPDTKPLQALRSARELVRLRRWLVVRKLLLLILGSGLLAVVILLPITLVVPGVVSMALFILGLAAVFVAHSYIYQLYRELLT